MEADQVSTVPTAKGKKTAIGPLPSTVHNNPTAFFLKSEKEMENSVHRGRNATRESTASEEAEEDPSLGDSSYGVESLEDTINSTFSSHDSLSRIHSNSAEPTPDTSIDGSDSPGRKRRAGNPVHPKIFATGQRIISSEWAAPQLSQMDSPTSLKSAESPFRTRQLRRESITSSINLSQPATPIKMSPTPDSALPSTPRSGSPKSFRLSDEEGSVVDETHSHDVLSPYTDGLGHSRPPQLVMPSLSIPTRRPFTEQGRQIGRATIMVLGPKGVGKTSFIHGLLRSCPHIVHVDEMPSIYASQASLNTDSSSDRTSSPFKELLASTRPHPPWWSDIDSQRGVHKRADNGNGVLERNLTFIDTPGLEGDEQVRQVMDFVKCELSHAVDGGAFSDHEWLNMLSGAGGSQIDAVLYLFDPALVTETNETDIALTPSHRELLQYLSSWTNFIPIIGKADTVPSHTLSIRKQQIRQMLNSLKATPYSLTEHTDAHSSKRNDSLQTEVPATETKSEAATLPENTETSQRIIEPFAISSALGDDMDTIDASVLMSSQYVQPLIPSELKVALDNLLNPVNIARLRHSSAIKILRWRRENVGYKLSPRDRRLRYSPQLGSTSPEATSMGSMLEEPGKVVVPHASSSYFRSTSPSVSDASGSIEGTSVHALAKYHAQRQATEPFRQVRLAKWAQDLQRSLHNERQKYKQMYYGRSYDWTSDSDSEKHADTALVPARGASRPGRGRLGGDLGIIDPRDPLGVLAFGQAIGVRGVLALQVVGSFGILGAVAYWVVRNWMDVQAFLGFGQSTIMVNAAAVPPPTRGWLDDTNVRNFFGWGR